MESEDMKSLELDKICRCCLTVKKEMRSLFSETIAQLLQETVQIQVENTDGWPDKICVQCAQLVCRFHSFKQRVEKMDKTLREYIKGLTVVVEAPLPVPQEVTVLARPPAGTQVINGAPLLTATAPFPQSVQMPPNAQIVQGGQFIPLQLCNSQPPQLVQIRRRPDETCEIILPQRGALNVNPTMQAVVKQGQTQYYEDAMQSLEEEPVGAKEDAIEEEISEECDEAEEYEEVIGDEDEVEEYEESQQGEEEEEETYLEYEDEEGQEQEPQIVEQEEDLYVNEEETVATEEYLLEVPSGGSSPVKSPRKTRSLLQSNSSPLKSCVDLESLCAAFDDPEVREFAEALTSNPGPGRHVCNLCHKEFANTRALFVHMKSHSNWIKANCKKQPECEICHKKFQGTGMLKMHMKVHEERTLKCELCLKCFQNEHFLQLHRAKHKEGDNMFSCKECNMSFISANDLKMHKRTVHGRTERGQRGGGAGAGSKKASQSDSLWEFAKRQKV